MDKTRNGPEVEGVGSLPRGRSESGVRNVKNLNPLPVLHPKIADAGALPPLRADPVVEGNPHNATVVRVSGILPKNAHPRGSTR